MLITENNGLTAKHSTCKQRGRTKRATSGESQTTVQIIHQYVIPQIPSGLIGEKVVYNEQYIKWHEKRGSEIAIPLPPCGYFTILQAVLHDDGRVTVQLSDHENLFHMKDGTHICISNLKPYKENT
jgi:hypothetical protein